MIYIYNITSITIVFISDRKGVDTIVRTHVYVVKYCTNGLNINNFLLWEISSRILKNYGIISRRKDLLKQKNSYTYQFPT